MTAPSQHPGGDGTTLARPFVSVILPCLNEAGFIEECLACVRSQTYPGELLEILVADGGSTDGTLAILEREAAADGRIRTIHNPDRIQSAGMNCALREARGEVLIRMDVHAKYAPSYIQTCIDVLRRTGADNVGGAPRAISQGRFQQALCDVLSSRLGTGGSPNRSAEHEGFVDTVFNGCFRRSVFERVGLYDPKAVTNEDAELNQRLVDAGGRIYISPAIEAYYYPRSSFRGLARQYFRYGKGRARTMLKHRHLLSIRPMIPFLMVLGAVVLLAAPWLREIAPWCFGAYGAATLLEAARVGRRSGPLQILLAWLIFPTMHIAHGLGMATGLVLFALHPDWGPSERLPPRAIDATQADRPASAGL